MRSITLELDSNEELISLLDKRYDHIFISQFNPHEAISWWSSSIELGSNFDLKNVSVRNMNFDLNVNLDILKKLINLNTSNLNFHQLDRSMPDTLDLQFLPENTKNEILSQNGFKHSFFIQFEFLTIESTDESFIDDIVKNESLRIVAKT